MPEDMSPGASPFDRLRSASRGRLLWISSWALGFALLGIVLVAATNHTVNWSSSDKFCGTACHSMTWAAAAYQQSPHYINRVGIRASCGECHIPYDSGHGTAKQYAKLLLFKSDRGAKDFWYEARKSIATNEEWEKRRPALSSTFQSYLTRHNYITCRGCHSLDAFGGAGSHMKVAIHRGLANGSSFDCLQCHVNIGHFYKQSAAKMSGWYTVEQAAAGAKL
jgi:cytochrome c-type protein NapC